ncbi:MAG: DNA/RNA non-specific endonuclease [Planctomycetota bacterium]
MSRRRSDDRTGLWLAVGVLAVVVVVACVLPHARRPVTPAPQAVEQPPTSAPAWAAHVYMGLPQPEASYLLLVNRGYVVGYSEERRDPLWAAYRLFPVSDPPQSPRPRSFSVDERTTGCVSHDDYRPVTDRFDRGHMAPNHAIATRYGREAQLETFLMSNVCPQAACLNEGTWEAFEKVICDDYAGRGEVYVVAGPIFGPAPERLPAGVEVPDAFYTIVVAPGANAVPGAPAGSVPPPAAPGVPVPQMLAIVMDQSVEGERVLSEFVTTVDDVEQRSGLDFFAELPDDIERAAESAPPDPGWQIDQPLVPRFKCRLK